MKYIEGGFLFKKLSITFWIAIEQFYLLFLPPDLINIACCLFFWTRNQPADFKGRECSFKEKLKALMNEILVSYERYDDKLGGGVGF